MREWNYHGVTKETIHNYDVMQSKDIIMCIISILEFQVEIISFTFF